MVRGFWLIFVISDINYLAGFVFDYDRRFWLHVNALLSFPNFHPAPEKQKADEHDGYNEERWAPEPQESEWSLSLFLTLARLVSVPLGCRNRGLGLCGDMIGNRSLRAGSKEVVILLI
jgi:hypothetical protein